MRFGTQEGFILPPLRNESRIRVPLRDEPHESHSQQTQTRTDEEERMSSRPSRRIKVGTGYAKILHRKHIQTSSFMKLPQTEKL